MGVKIIGHVIKIGRSINICGISIVNAVHHQGSLTRAAVTESVGCVLIMVLL